MDVTNEQKDKTGSTKPPLLPKPCLGSMSSGPAEHIIPQMVITSPDESEGMEFSQVPEVIVTESFNEVPNEPRDTEVQTEIPQSQLIDGIPQTDDIDKGFKVEDSSTHTAIQRPLIFESEKGFPESTNEELCDPTPPESPSPPPALPTITSQRPLIFGGQQPENFVSSQEDVFEECQLDMSTDKHESPETDGIVLDELNLKEECKTPEPAGAKPKSSGFSWVPSFPKLPASSKEGKSSDVSVTKKDKEMVANQKTQSTDQSPAKKEGLHGMKKFFDNLIHDISADSKNVTGMDNQGTELSGECSKKPKDGKHGIKKLFSPTKEVKLYEKDGIHEHKKDVKNVSAKDSKSNIKQMFDTFKPADKKDSASKSDTEVPQIEVTPIQIEPKQEDASKEPKSNLKKMFDSFKHVDKKDDQSKKETSTSPTESTSMQNESKTAEDVSKDYHKDSKSNIKKMLDSFKHADKKETSTKDTQNVVTELHEGACKTDKESKSGIKKFFDSFKHEETTIDATNLNKPAKTDKVSFKDEESVEIHTTTSSPKIIKSIQHSDDKESLNSTITPQHASSQNKTDKTILKKEPTVSKQGSSEHSVKKRFYPFKQDTPGTSKEQTCKFHVKFLDRETSLKRSHSFQESLLLNDPKSPDGEKTQKESFHGVKKYFSSNKSSDPESAKSGKKEKSKEIKRSQSCKETLAEKEGFHGIRGFFDSLKHKSTPKVSSQTAISQSDTKEEHIYDTVGKPEASASVSQVLAEGPTKQSASKMSDTHKDDHSGVRKLFDSLLHKDSQSTKPAIAKTEDCRERTYEKIDISSAVERPTGTGRTFMDMKKERDASKENSEAQHQTNIVQKPADNQKVVESVSPDTSKKAEAKVPLSAQMNGSSTSDAKNSVFHSISDNLMAIKDRMLHSKEKKSEPDVNQEKEFEEYDLQIAASTNDKLPDISVGTFRPLKDDFDVVSYNKKETTSTVHKSSGKTLDLSLPTTSKMSVSKSVPSDPKQLKPPGLKTCSKVEPGTPDTLYDTCCVRIARLLGKKALEIVSDRTKTPPQKPPKPSAEAIAKARAEVVSQRLRNLQNKGQSIGASIPVGYDGIRFADDETESSCDYKDVDNLDYILDYELINRYKFDGTKVDAFSAQSTCSISSYYTADTVTLKDEQFSDAQLETISLGSNDSRLFQHLSTNNQCDFNSLPSKVKSKDKNISKVKPLDFKTSVGNTSTPKKKIPPPLPPKPVWSPKLKDSQTNSSDSQQNNKSTVSQCINGLSLSPRLQSKFSKDKAAVQKRPLLVAGLKGTEFTSLQTKTKDNQNKRTFNTVLKNESLSKINTISPLHPPLKGTKSSPSELLETRNNQQSSLTKKVSPQRPPPPLSLSNSENALLKNIIGPPVPEKPKRESKTTPSQLSSEKITISPLRPPPQPPVSTKTNIPPPRPPPPTSNLRQADLSSYQNILSEVASSSQSFTEQPSCSENFETKNYVDALDNLPLDSNSKPSEDNFVEISLHENTQQNEVRIMKEMDQSPSKLNMRLFADQNNTNSQHDSSNALSLSFEQSPQSSAVGSSVPSPIQLEDFCSGSTPKPPPRFRRIRSRTVEMAPKEKVTEVLRRSQSLTDIDIQKRGESLNIPKTSEKTDFKHLYTSVNKDGKRSALNGSQSPNLGGRPLPAPPPPPRRFRSLDRKPKEKLNKEHPVSNTSGKESFMLEYESPGSTIRPPERKKKGEKNRFHSLSTERKKTQSELVIEASRIPRSNSVPMKPDRRLRHGPEYDENANVAFPVVAEVHHSAVQLDECGNEILNSPDLNIPPEGAVDSEIGISTPPKVRPHPRQKKEKNPKEKSHSSWYDESQATNESWEIVDWDPISLNDGAFRDSFASGKKPLRRRSDPLAGRKERRRTSNFYVDLELEEGKPGVDKETSPLHLDCSEKSVQTSLETLSQGFISHDEHSEIAESSDNTDNLISMVKTLQTELKSTLDRHNKVLDSDENGNNSNAATDSEKAKEPNKLLKIPSNQSSASENWPATSSEESDNEMGSDAASNLSEIALTRKKKKVFYIAQEIMTSEEVFVDTLKLLNVDFKAAVETANKQRNTPIVPDEVLSQILNHLPQLQHLNENLLMELKDRIDNWNKTEKIADVIVKMGPFLKLYSWFIHDFESNLSLLEEAKRKHPLFAQTVKEFEASPRCKRLTLNHFMLKPIQRIPQYRLLLQEYLHNLSEESPDYQDTVTALQIVSEVANHANDSMKQGDNAQKLISIQNSIMGHKEIIKPGRLFMKEGELMKLSRKGMQPRWFVLFNDLLLYLTPVQQGLYRINHELPLTGMRVAIPVQQDYQNEFSIISVTRSFTLAARSQEEREEWIEVLENSIKENASKRSTFTNTRLSQRVHGKNSEEDSGEFVLGRKAPVWIPDARVTMCQLCTSEFTVTFRRHHCRACGKVVCSICSGFRLPLAYLGSNKVNRVCDECYSRLGPDAGACAESGETDSDNQQIAVKPHLRTERYVKKGKRNLPSVLKEVCANDQGSTISGYLQKRIGKSWKREWFVVKDKVLYEYKASEDVAALKSIPLLGYQIESFTEAYENVDSSLLFQLTHPGQAPIIFYADSVGSTERWIAALKEASILE